jgi:hypothetical protein
MAVEDEQDLEVSTVLLGGEPFARRRVGEEQPPCESPCPGCGAYYFGLHMTGCEQEQCPRCGGPLETCGC